MIWPSVCATWRTQVPRGCGRSLGTKTGLPSSGRSAASDPSGWMRWTAPDTLSATQSKRRPSAVRSRTPTSPTGTFTFSQIPPSVYEISVDQPGFQRTRLTGLNVNANDQRSVRVRLTAKGQAIRNRVDALYDRQLRAVEQVAGLGADELERINKSLARLERYWTDQILYRL